MCAWVRIPLLSNFAFKSQHFGRSRSSESQIKSKTEEISHYKKMLSKTGWSKCDILKAGWPSGVRRQTQEILLWGFWYTNVCLGSNPTPVKFCVQKANILVEAVFLRVKSRARRSRFHITRRCYRRQDVIELCVQKANILVEAGVLRVKWEARQTDSTLQEGVIEDRMKQVRYTQGRMAERSKAPDSRNSPLRLLVHECVRGFESHSCQILRSNRQNFNRSSIESHSRQILRSKSQHFGPSSISESQIKRKTKQISHYKKVLSKTGWSKCDILKAGWPSGLRRQTQEILLWGFWYTNVCLGSNTTPVKFCVQKPTFWSKQEFWESNQEQDGADFTLQEDVIEDRMLSNFAFKKPTFWSKQEFWESNEKQDKLIPHYKKVLSKTEWSKCDKLKAG